MAINFEQVDQAVRDGHSLDSIVESMKGSGIDTTGMPTGNYEEMTRAIRDGHSMSDIASHIQQTPNVPNVPTSMAEALQTGNLDIPDSPSTATIPGDLNAPTELPGDTVSTVTTGDPTRMDKAISDVVVPGLEQTAEITQTGVAASAAGAIQTGYDIVNMIPGINADDSNNQEVIKLLNDEIAAYEKKYGEGFNSADMGRLLPVLATAPIAYSSKLVAFAIEGMIGYADTRGTGSSKGQALVNGLLAGGLTAGVMKGIDMLSTPAAKVAYDEIIARFNYTTKEADKIYNNWTKVMGASDNVEADRVKALLDHADKNRFGLGERFKAKAASEDIDVAVAVEKEIIERKQSIKELASTKYGTFEEAAADINKVNNQIKDDYQYIKETIAPTEIKGTFDTKGLPEGEAFENLPDYMRSDIVELKSLSTNPNPTVNDLLDASKAVNSLLSRPSMKGTSKGYNLGQVKGQINASLKKHLPPEDFKKWMTVNSDYRRMKQVQNSKLGQAMEQIIGTNAKADSKTITQFLHDLPAMTESKETFKAIEHLIGTDKAGKLESKIVDTLLDSPNPYNWERLHNAVGKKGFTTKSGQALQDLSKNLSESFKNDAAYKAALQDIEIHQGAKTTVESMLDAVMIRELSRMVVRKLPTQAGALARQEQRLSKILSNPNNVKKVQNAIDNLGVGVRQQMIREAVKQIEYKPGAVQTGDVDLQPRYVTEAGTVGDTPTATKLYEAQNKLLNDFLETSLNPRNANPEDVITKVHDIASDAKMTGIAKNVAAKMKVDDAVANTKRLRNVITKEAHQLIRRLEKDMGIKLPGAEAEKIIKMKFDKLASECN